jgi:hypothetical protein
VLGSGLALEGYGVWYGGVRAATARRHNMTKFKVIAKKLAEMPREPHPPLKEGGPRILPKERRPTLNQFVWRRFFHFFENWRLSCNVGRDHYARWLESWSWGGISDEQL